MPKHNIYPRPNPDGDGQNRRLELQWQRDSHLSLASTIWAGDPAQIDTGREFIPGPAGEALMPAWQGEFLQLERDQVNHLIRQLRIARDQAYGRDE
jgi:hypothetical protein